jgi:hypothetical protein
MPSVFLMEFNVSIDIDNFTEIFWIDNRWYEKFLIEKLNDMNVKIGEWSTTLDGMSTKSRNVRSFHPSKISFPGLPSHAEVKFLYFIL